MAGAPTTTNDTPDHLNAAAPTQGRGRLRKGYPTEAGITRPAYHHPTQPTDRPARRRTAKGSPR